MPFAKYQYYHGGKKQEIDARRYVVNDTELGGEWQWRDYFELTALYTISDRIFEDSKLPQNQQKGRLLKLQAQVNVWAWSNNNNLLTFYPFDCGTFVALIFIL